MPAFNRTLMYGSDSGVAAGRRGFDVGSLGGLATVALSRENQALQQAQGQAQQQAQAMTAGGANPFAAGRAAMGSATQAQAGIRAQTDAQLAQIGQQAQQIRMAEEERKRQEARQLVGGLLSTGGAVLGTVVGGPMGSQLGGSLGGGLGGMLTESGGQRPPQPGQVQTPQKPPMGMSPGNTFGTGSAPLQAAPQDQMQGAPQAPTQQQQQQQGAGGLLGGLFGGGGGGGGLGGLLNPFSFLGIGR